MNKYVGNEYNNEYNQTKHFISLSYNDIKCYLIILTGGVKQIDKYINKHCPYIWLYKNCILPVKAK